MKIPHPKNKSSLLYILTASVIFTIPFYAYRIPVFSSSLSILTIGLFILSIAIFILHHKQIPTTLQKERLLWVFATLFILSFIPRLLLQPDLHGTGVFIEWILLPMVAGFLLTASINKSARARIIILNSIGITTFLISVISLIYFVLDVKTFDGRLTAFYPSSNHLAFFLAPLIPLLIHNFLNSKQPLLKAFFLTTFLLSSLTLFLTNSLISSVSIIITLFTILVIYIRRKYLTLIFVLVTFSMISIVGLHKIKTIELAPAHNSFYSRTEIWTVALQYIQENPLSAHAPIDSFGQIYLNFQQYYPPYNTWSAPTPHNLFLTLWISGGFFSVLFFSLIYARILFLSFLAYQKSRDITTLLYIAPLLIILFSAIVDTPFWKNDLSVIFWLLIVINIQEHLYVYDV